MKFPPQKLGISQLVKISLDKTCYIVYFTPGFICIVQCNAHDDRLAKYRIHVKSVHNGIDATTPLTMFMSKPLENHSLKVTVKVNMKELTLNT